MDFGIVNGGAQFTNYNSATEINKMIKDDRELSTNNQYRAYLTQNASTIIEHNKQTAIAATPFNPVTNQLMQNPEKKYIIFSNYNENATGLPGYVDSDLKRSYLSRMELESRRELPYVNQESLLQHKNN